MNTNMTTTRNTCAKVFTFLILFTLCVITSATLATLSPHYAKHIEQRFQARIRHNQQVPLCTPKIIFASPKPNDIPPFANGYSTQPPNSRTGSEGVVI